jgi:hypothetical protein
MILMTVQPKHGELTEPKLTNALIDNQTQKVNLKSLIAKQSGLACKTQAQPKISNKMRKEKQTFVFVRPTACVTRWWAGRDNAALTELA